MKIFNCTRTVQRQGPRAVERHPGSVIREVDEAGEAFNEMLVGLRERETLRDLFGRYVPEEIASRLIQQGGALEPVSAECTVLYADIEGFSSLAESLPAGSVVEMLNAYFTTATEIIERRKGVITQFQGDAILAIYNIPVRDPVHACNAVETAVELNETVSKRQFAGQALKIRIGISTGQVVAGNVGAEGRLGYTVHGDAVNLAARLEEMNKQFSTRILVSEVTKFACPTHVFDSLGEVSVRGKRKRLTVFSEPV